jgi:hypothetical protein
MDVLSRIFDWLSDHEAGISAVAAIIVIAGVVFSGIRSLLMRRAENSAEKIRQLVCQKRGRAKSIEHVLESVPSIGHRFREDLCPGSR